MSVDVLRVQGCSLKFHAALYLAMVAGLEADVSSLCCLAVCASVEGRTYATKGWVLCGLLLRSQARLAI